MALDFAHFRSQSSGLTPITTVPTFSEKTCQKHKSDKQTTLKRVENKHNTCHPTGICPFGMTRCCYNKNEVEMNLIDDCEPIQHQEAEDNFGLCNQGCSAKLPSKMMTFTIAPEPAPKPAPKPTPAVSKAKKPSFGAAFGRTETIGVTKQCGHREFDDLNLPKSEVSIILNDNALSPCRARRFDQGGPVGGNQTPISPSSIPNTPCHSLGLCKG